MIGLIDYGAGNLLSVQKAMKYTNIDCKIIDSIDKFNGIDKVILPGVGAFEAAVKKLNSSGLFESVKNWIKSDKPFLGICLGMQLLFEESEESTENIHGFGIFKGNVSRFKTNKVPQIGWNQIQINRESKLFNNIGSGSFFYFLHGYYVDPSDKNITITSTEYSINYTSAVNKGNIFGVQFHPEKSGENGLKLLKNWVDLC
jgi:glutamine amidotransferase